MKQSGKCYVCRIAQNALPSVCVQVPEQREEKCYTLYEDISFDMLTDAAQALCLNCNSTDLSNTPLVV
jgi:hypothetical protein